MIWLLTVPLALVAAYSVLCLVLNAATGGGTSSGPYWVLLGACAIILYVAWFHPVRVAFG